MTRYQDGTTNASYTYYPDNMRKSKKVGNETTTHIWLEDEIALDMTDGNVVNYIHGLKLIVSDYGWYHYNAHGDVVQLSGDNGLVVRDYDYDPYGNIIQSTSSTDENLYRYCKEYYDTETGFTYLRARYYDSNIGRFISEDPALDGLNWYVYCENDPINMIDPTGLVAQPIPGPGPSAKWTLNYGNVQRQKAVDYAKKYKENHNWAYKYFGNNKNCANFVSQCLYAAWGKTLLNWNPGFFHSVLGKGTKAWQLAKSQYNYFDRSAFRSKKIKITKKVKLILA